MHKILRLRIYIEVFDGEEEPMTTIKRKEKTVNVNVYSMQAFFSPDDGALCAQRARIQYMLAVSVFSFSFVVVMGSSPPNTTFSLLFYSSPYMTVQYCKNNFHLFRAENNDYKRVTNNLIVTFLKNALDIHFFPKIYRGFSECYAILIS